MRKIKLQVGISAADDKYLNKRYLKYLKHAKAFDAYHYIFKKYFTDKKVLDLGCGNGFFSVQIAAYAKFVTGIDINEKYIFWAKQLAQILSPANSSFEIKSAYDIDKLYLIHNEIDAVFIHKVGGNWGVNKFAEIINIVCSAKVRLLVSNKKPDAKGIVDTISYFRDDIKYDFNVIEYNKWLVVRENKNWTTLF